MLCPNGSEKKPEAPPYFDVRTGAICFLLGLPDGPLCQLLDTIPNLIGKPWKSILKETAKNLGKIIIDTGNNLIDTAAFCELDPPPMPDEITYIEVAAWIASYIPVVGFLPLDEPLIKKITQIYLHNTWYQYCRCKDKKNPPPNPDPPPNDPPVIPDPPPNIHVDPPPRNHRNWCYQEQWQAVKKEISDGNIQALADFTLLKQYTSVKLGFLASQNQSIWYLLSEYKIFYTGLVLDYNKQYVQYGLGKPETSTINYNGVIINRTCYPFFAFNFDAGLNNQSPYWNVRRYFLAEAKVPLAVLIESTRRGDANNINLIIYNNSPSVICFSQIIGYDGNLPPCPSPPDGGNNGDPPPPPPPDGDDCREESYEVNAWDGTNCSPTNRILLDGADCKLVSVVVFEPPKCLPSVKILRTKSPQPEPPLCTDGSEKKPSAPSYFAIETGAICFLLDLPDSPVCKLLDTIPGMLGKSWKTIIKQTAKNLWQIVVDYATDMIDTADFCSTEPPPQPDEITYLEVAGWIASYLPIVGLLPIDDPLMTKITTIYLRKKWLEYCQCATIEPPPPPRNDYPISITIYFAVGNDGINPTIEDRNQDNWAITDNGDGTRTIQYLLQITVQLVADAQFQGYFEVLLNDGTVVSGNYDGAIGQYAAGDFFSISYPSVTT